MILFTVLLKKKQTQKENQPIYKYIIHPYSVGTPIDTYDLHWSLGLQRLEIQTIAPPPSKQERKPNKQNCQQNKDVHINKKRRILSLLLVCSNTKLMVRQLMDDRRILQCRWLVLWKCVHTWRFLSTVVVVQWTMLQHPSPNRKLGLRLVNQIHSRLETQRCHKLVNQYGLIVNRIL